MPFNQRTPIGYMAAAFIQFSIGYYNLMNCCCILSFFIGTCWILNVIVDDIGKEFKIESEPILRTRLYNIVELHSTARQFSTGFDSHRETKILQEIKMKTKKVARFSFYFHFFPCIFLSFKTFFSTNLDFSSVKIFVYSFFVDLLTSFPRYLG